jgi:GT2 family glycosyltransferase
MSMPFSQYQAWRERFPILTGPSVALRSAVLMVGPGAVDDTLESLHAQTHTDWVAAALPSSHEPTGLHSELVRTFLDNEGANCDFVVFALAGTLFTPAALQRIAGTFSEFTNAQAIYADLDLQSNDGSVWPLMLPAFDYERMLEQGYCAYFFALRRAVAKRALDSGATSLYRLFNSMLDDEVPKSDIIHLPGALATLPQFDKKAASATLATAASEHLQHRGIEAQVIQRSGGALPAVQITRTSKHPRTTIIIPTRNRKTLLKNCIESIRPAVERTETEILIVDNDSSDPDTLTYLADLENRGVTVLRVSGEFNFPRLNNRAVNVARGEVLCLLNNDIKALDEHWLEEMLSRVADDGVGAVGALLVSPSGVVQHGGVVLGPSFAATHAFNDRIDGDGGYGDLLRVAHECNAVTAACLVTPKRDYLAVGGMDEVRFPVNFNDVDYCLKLRANGKRIVFTPDAKLLHIESASRGIDIKSHEKKRFERELHNLRTKWGSTLAADCYYSPILSLDPIPFSALAWPPRTVEPRVNCSPVPTQVPAGF